MKKLLLADDSVTIQRVIELTFSGEDVDVLTASDGEEAVARIAADKPDIVLADIGMPKRSGYDVLRELRSDESCAGMKVIMLTARAQDRDVDVGFSLGADDYITKPFSPQELRVRIGAHLNKR